SRPSLSGRTRRSDPEGLQAVPRRAPADLARRFLPEIASGGTSPEIMFHYPAPMTSRSPRPALPRRFRSATPIVLAWLLSFVATPDAQTSILYEYIPPDPTDDVSFSATTLDGDLPAAIQTPSGVATAPDPQRPPGKDRVYGGAGIEDGPNATYG